MPVLPRRDLFGRQACCCYTNGAKEMVAGPGIAPGSSAFQAGALTDSAIQRGPSAWFRATVCRLSGGGSAIELQKDEGKVVARDGNAPPSAGCGPAALLLSYRAIEKWYPHPVTLRGFPIESRTCCDCTMRAENGGAPGS